MTKELLSGNEAVARGAWEAGVLLGTGYPGTPSSEILEYLASFPETHSQWCSNEKVALEVASGASFSGGRVLVTMKHVGLNVASDPLFTLAYTGVKGGLVIAVADDPGAHSSQNEQDSRHYARAAKIPLLEPSDSEEAKDFVKLAFRLSEKFDLPVLLRLTTRVSHSRSPVRFGKRKEIAASLDFVSDRGKYVMVPAHARIRRRLLEDKLTKLAEYAEKTSINRREPGKKSPRIITSGIAYEYCKEVRPDASYLKLGMVYPLPVNKIKNFCRGAEKVFIVEELDPFLETEIKSMGLKVKEKRKEYRRGELNPDRVRSLFAGKAELPSRAERIPARPPVMCAGCPHRGVFWVLKKLKLTVTGDIGCYTLGTLPPLEALHTCLCMGAGVGQSEGLRRVLPPEKGNRVVAVIGDSTFIHSGITGLIDIAYNGEGGVVIILDNRTTAMTGRQEHPATGRTLQGKKARRLDLARICRAAGVRRVKVINAYQLQEMEDFLRQSLPLDEPSVMIARAPCVLLERDKGENVFRVDEKKCTGCGLCLRTGCPAIVPRKDGKVKIEEESCTGCSVCAQVCPAEAILEFEE